MAERASNSFSMLLKKRSDLFVAGGVIAVVMMMLIPLPTVLLDLLMTLNLIISLLTILIVLYTRDALEFSVFPTILLVLTVFGLALNISSTRLILSRGSAFNGRIIRAFASFVVGTEGSEGLVIGLIIFIIIVAVQFIVITKGSTRVAEVAARFTLDALPGKQMAIEAEYNSGVLTEEEAHQKKTELEREVDFYGAMDGASKFVSGNVKVGILITVVNIVGGIIVGISIHGETLNTALNTYLSLAVGDGLVTQFPALLVSTATGIIVTRAISESTFGEDVTSQFSGQGRIYLIAALFLAVLGFLPGFPWYLLFPMSFLAGWLGFRLTRKMSIRQHHEELTRRQKKPDESAAGDLSPIAPLDPLSLELGYTLVPLVDKDKGAELLDRIVRIRREIALDLGLVVPRIRIVDNMRLDPAAYSFKIRGVVVGESVIKINQYLCISPGQVSEEIPGEPTTDPTFGLPAKWINEEMRQRAEQAGYTVIDPPSIIATHLTELIRANAAEILGRQEVKAMLDALRKDFPAVVDDHQKNLSLGETQKVLQGLLNERVSIRNLVAIFESMVDYCNVSKKPDFLIEKARQALKRQISQQYIEADRTLRVMTVAQVLEQHLIENATESSEGAIALLEPQLHRRLMNTVADRLQQIQREGHHPILLCSEAARPLLSHLLRRRFPSLTVLSIQEIVSGITIETFGEIAIEGLAESVAT